MQIDLRAAIKSKNPKLEKKIPNFCFRWLENLLCVEKLNYFLERHSNDSPIDFATNGCKYLGAEYNAFPEENIPQTGRYIIVSNHPLGGVDGLSLISIMGKYRSDIQFPVNDLLMQLKPMEGVFIPINKHGKNASSSINRLHEAFESDDLIIYFPAGLCSRKQNGVVRDLEWKKTVVSKARETHRDIIPVFFGGENSNKFYRLARWRKRLGIKFNIEMLLLPSEAFGQKGKVLPVVFGKPIPYQHFDSSKNDKEWAAWLKEQVYYLKNIIE